MERPLLVDKPIGATPLQALELLRGARRLRATEKMSYAGRLDPMASGLLPILYGEMLQHQEDYWHLPKQYEARVLIGIETDSYDVLGLPTRAPLEMPAVERVTAVVRGLVGKTYLSVPVYSSYRVGGQPLFTLAREDRIPESILVPARRMSVSQVDVMGTDTITHEELHERVSQRVRLVTGDFRQEAIMRAWQEAIACPGEWMTVSLSIHCASGTYIRSLAHEIGRRLKASACLIGLRRVRVGPWSIEDPEVFAPSWPPQAS